MRGIDLVVEGASGGTSHVIADIPGARYIGFYFDGAWSLARNLAPDGPAATVTGSPVIRPGYITLTGNADFISTNLLDSTEMTYIAVVRGRDVVLNNAPIFVGNYAGSSRGNFGASLFIRNSPLELAVAAETDNSGAYVSNQQSLGASPVVTTWSLVAARVSASQILIWDWGRNLANTLTLTYPRYLTGNPIRVGSGHHPAFSGACDVAMAGIWNRALTNAEIDQICTRVRAIVAMDGIIV